MARWLYQLGAWSARRAWLVILVWALALGVAGGAASVLSQPFTSKITIPGTEFQTVVDDLQSALPKAAGGSATVVFHTADGQRFTDAQKAAIGEVVTAWDKTDGVEDATNPFTTQKKLDDAKTKVADGKDKLADGRAKIKTNTRKLRDARDKIADGRQTIATNRQKLADGVVKLDDAQKKLDAGRKKLNTGAAKLAKGEKKLVAARAQLKSGRQQLETALATQGMTVDAVPGALAQLEQAIAMMQQQLAQLIDQVGAGDPQVAALEEQIATYTAQADQLQTVVKSIRKLEAGEKQLTDGFRQLAKGKAKIAAGRRQLATGQRTIDENRAKVADGQRQLTDGVRKLDDAADKVADGERKLADGRRKLDDGTADLDRGVRQLALTSGIRMVSEKGDVAATNVSFTLPTDSVPAATKAAIPAAAAHLADSGVLVEYSKDITSSRAGLGGEASGLIVAAVVLLVMLGSLIAAGLPLLTAAVGVGVGMLGVLVVTHWVQMTDVTPILALMLGLAVGIDYALFLVNRHRHQLVEGMDIVESIGRATGTAGSAVLVAGLTVVTALAALTLTGVPFLGVMGLAAAATVAVAVLVSITLTPALLRLTGPRILSRKGRAKLVARQQQSAPAPSTASMHAKAGRQGGGWGGLVTRHPVLALVASVAVLGLLAVPAAALKLGLPDGSYEPEDTTAYRAYSLISDNFGPGQNGTIIAVAKLPEAAARTLDKDALTDRKLDIAEQLREIPGISYVVPALTSKDHQTLVFQIMPTTGPSDDATSALVHALRDDRDAVISTNGLTSLGFAGQTVANIDISARLAGALPGYLAVVVGISLILLLLVFRSLLVPLLATAGFLLSVGAAFGAVVAVYQWGWLGALFGVEHPGLVLSFLPTIAIGILFGLAMDYQMFLVSGMREAWAHGEDARSAVRAGFSHGARVITAAGLIMTAVFGGFMFSHLVMVRPIGFALAFGILIDAFVVRMTIMPAVMHLLGERAWYLPRWLDRILPELDVEGAKLSEWLQRPAPARSGYPVVAAPEPA